MRCSELGGTVVVAIDASWRRVAELGSLGGITRMKFSRPSSVLGTLLRAALAYGCGFAVAIALHVREWTRGAVMLAFIVAVPTTFALVRYFADRRARRGDDNAA